MRVHDHPVSRIRPSTLHVMNAAGQLSDALEADIEALAAGAMQRAAQELNLRGVDVAVYVHPGWVIPETGVCGYAPLGHWVQITLDPANPNFDAVYRQEIPWTVAHELHHAKRQQGPGYGQTLLEAIVSEGLAQHYEASWRGEAPPYARGTNLDPLWVRAQTDLSGPYDHRAWFFGDAARDLPRWGGYALGYELVRRHMNRTGGNAVGLAHAPAEAFAQSWAP